MKACAADLTSCWSFSFREGDRERVVTVEQLSAFGLELPADASAHETSARELWFDGTVILDYEFDPPAEWEAPYLYSMAEVHPSARDACLSHAAGGLGTRLGGVEVDVRDDVFRHGDRSTFALLVDDGEPYGTYFSMCRGRTAFSLVVAGWVFDDADEWRSFLGETLEHVDQLPWD